MDASVRGAENFLALSKSLKAAGRASLRRELNGNMRRAGRPLIAKTRAVALSDLPSRGGLAAIVASEPQRVQVRTGEKTAGIRIVVGERRGGARGADLGLVRHPVFGRDEWTTQPVKPGWFSGTLAAEGADITRPFVEDAMKAIADKIIEGARRG